MGYAAAAVILILILAWLLMRMKIHLTFEYLHDKDNDKLTFKLSALYGLIRIKKTLPVIKVNSEDASIAETKEYKYDSEVNVIDQLYAAVNLKRGDGKAAVLSKWMIKEFKSRV